MNNGVKKRIEAIRINLTGKTMIHKIMQTKNNNTHEIITTIKVEYYNGNEFLFISMPINVFYLLTSETSARYHFKTARI